MVKFKCCKCGAESSSKKEFKKLPSGFFCKKCYQEKRANHREYLKRDILGIEKRGANKSKENPLIKETFKPAIKPIRQKKPRISSLGIYITKEEKKERYWAFIRQGMSSEEANERVNNICKRMSELKKELKETVKSKEELNRRFKESFEELCMRY